MDGGALDDVREQAVLVLGAHAARHRAVFGEGVLDLIADHAVAELIVVLRLRQIVVHLAEGVRAVEIVRVDDRDGAALGELLRAPDRVRRAERLFASLGRGQTLRQVIERLIGVIDLHEAARLAADGLLERLVQLGADDEHHALEAGAVRVVDRVIQNDLTVRTDGVDLLEAAVARAHACRHNDQNRFIHMFSSFQNGVFVSSAAVLYFAQIILLYRKGG